MNDYTFANELARRLDELVQDADALECIEKVIDHRLELRDELAESMSQHPSVTVHVMGTVDLPRVEVGLLGILNGLTGEKAIVAAYDDQTMRLHHFFVKDRHEADD